MTPTVRLCVGSAAAVLAALSFPARPGSRRRGLAADAGNSDRRRQRPVHSGFRGTRQRRQLPADKWPLRRATDRCGRTVTRNRWVISPPARRAAKDSRAGCSTRPLDPELGEPIGDIRGTYPVRDVLSVDAIEVGAPFCKIGAVTGETCGAVTDVGGNVIETSVFSLHGDSGSPGFIKNSDGTVSAVGILMSSPTGTTTPRTSLSSTRCCPNGA